MLSDASTKSVGNGDMLLLGEYIQFSIIYTIFYYFLLFCSLKELDKVLDIVSFHTCWGDLNYFMEKTLKFFKFHEFVGQIFASIALKEKKSTVYR